MKNTGKKIFREYRDLIVAGIVIGGLFIAFNFVLPAYLNTPTPIAYISSGSMEPTYYTGDLVIIRGVKGSDINVGDVIVFKPEGFNEYILHRVAAKKFENGKYYFLTKGDNPNTNRYIDTAWGWVSEDRVYGKVIYRLPYLGYIFMFLASLAGKVFIVILALIILLSDIGEENSNKEGSSGYFSLMFSKQYKRKTLALLSIIIIMLSLFVLFSSYIYIGGDEPGVEIIGFGPPMDRYSMSIYPVFIKVKSFGLNKGSVKEFSITPIRKSDNSTLQPVKWTILYVFIGEKTVCIDVFLPQGSNIYDYKFKVSIKIETFSGVYTLDKIFE